MEIVKAGLNNLMKNNPDVEVSVVEETLSFLKNFQTLDVDDLIVDYNDGEDYLTLRLYKGNKNINIIKNLTVEEYDDGTLDPLYMIIGWHEKIVKICGDHDDINYIVKVVAYFLEAEN